MSNNTFFTSRVILGKQVVPGMATWLVKRTVIKDLSQAKKIIIGLIVFDFVAMIIISYFFIIR